MVRLKRLPNVMYAIQIFLKKVSIECSSQNADGRINSCSDEDTIIRNLVGEFRDRIVIPEKRNWYDILIRDYRYGWIPINIKSTTTKTSDNTGNIAMCVHVYTDAELNLRQENTYNSGEMSSVLMCKFRETKFNRNPKKDYYFVVVNKQNTRDIIINSVKGLTSLTPNINNLPFQVQWDRNREFKYGNIKNKVRLFVECIQKPKPSWHETFLKDMRAYGQFRTEEVSTEKRKM